MKKTLRLVLCLVFILMSSFYAFGSNCDSYKGSNENMQNYSVWANTVKSYLHNCSDGKLMKVQYLANENKLLAEYYSDSFSRLSKKTINLKLPVFGGFYAVGESYFVLTGQNNLSELSTVACFAVTKYDKNWKEIGTALLKDCNTTIPFRAGSARFCHSGSYLIVRTSHEMYADSEDGLRHQANITFQLDMNSMKITDSHTSVASVNYGYVSHSFNQFVKIDSDKIVALDHGDAYPRSVILLKYKTSVSSGNFVPSYSKPCTAVDVFPISGAVGANQTGCSVGGFEITSSGYLAALNSIKQGTGSNVRDIYLSYVPSGSTAAVTKKLTSYTSAGASTPHLVKIDGNNFMVLWTYNGRVHYCKVNSKGDMLSSIYSFEGSLSDCQPIMRMGKIIWYVWNDSETKFYSISSEDISVQETATFTAGHSYSAVSVSGTAVEMKCSVCGETTKGNVPSAFYLYWEVEGLSDGISTTYSSAPESSYHPGKTIGLMPKYTLADLNDFEIMSSDESIVDIAYDNGFYYAKMKFEGTAKVTIKSQYNSAVKTDYTIKVSHSWSVKESTSATCTVDGKTVKTCSLCEETKTEIKPAAGHKMSEYSVVKAATCKATGSKKSTCSLCGFAETQEIPKTDHDKKVSLEAVSPTCTKQGKTAGKKCSVCGKITVEQESVEALGHSLGAYKITKNPTCTAQGEETATCSRCTYSKTQSVARVAHTEITVKAVAPTCTKQGKTAGKKCSVCDKITVEQEGVEALGHSFGDYEITKEPTCTAKGEKTANCIRCTYTKTADVAKTSHKEIVMKAVASTCTKNGKTEGRKCAECDKVILAQESIPAIGHKKKTVVLAKATTKANGKKSTVCGNCTEDFGENRIYRIQTVTLAKEQYTYDGKAKKPAVTVIDYNKDQLIKDRDYTVTYASGRKGVGRYSVKVKFKGDYSGTTTLYFEIIPTKTATLKATVSTTAVTLKWESVKGASGYKVYLYDTKSAGYKEIADTVKLQHKITKLKTGTKYKFAVRAYDKDSAGKVYLGAMKTVSAITKLTAPEISVKASGKTAMVSWNKISNATGYQVWYSTSEKGEYKKLTGTAKLTFKKTGLASGKKYYFKVRAYKKLGDSTVYSAFSKVKSVKIK